MSSKYANNRRGDSSDSDEEEERTKKPVKQINEVLARALALAAEPGEGDEEPEVLPPPPHTNNNAESKNADNEAKRGGDNDVDEEPEAKQFRREQEERNKQMAEEERRQAELNFDHDALLPFQSMRERAKYIPLRLTYEERKNLRLVNAAINVSDYTTEVDVQFKNKARRHHMQLQRIVAFLSGITCITVSNTF